MYTKKKKEELKVKVARLSIISNSTLIVLKTVVGILTGSISIISEAIHSFMDFLASVIAFFAVKKSSNPPDEHHPYGHGKIENLSGVIEALLIFIASIWIIYEACHNMMYPKQVEAIGWGFLVMLISAIVNFFISRKLYRVAKATDSIALEADALHLRTDIYTSLGISVALLVIWVTDLYIIDSIIAIFVALFILREAYHLLMKAIRPMLDEAWHSEDLEKLYNDLDKLGASYHEVKTRKSGHYRFVEFHLLVNPEITVFDAHKFCDEIEDILHKTFPDVTVTIHVEPDIEELQK